jgi:hypothetical protein
MIMKPPGVPSVPKCSQSVPKGTGVPTVPLFPTPYIGEQGTGTPKGNSSAAKCSQAQVFPMTPRQRARQATDRLTRANLNLTSQGLGALLVLY